MDEITLIRLVAGALFLILLFAVVRKRLAGEGKTLHSWIKGGWRSWILVACVFVVYASFFFAAFPNAANDAPGVLFPLAATVLTIFIYNQIAKRAPRREGSSAVVILVRRCVKPDKVSEFLASYKKPTHRDFVEETLTRLSSVDGLPQEMRNLPIECKKCVTYLNIARWRSAQSFAAFFEATLYRFDPEIECSERLRAVFEVVVEH